MVKTYRNSSSPQREYSSPHDSLSPRELSPYPDYATPRDSLSPLPPRERSSSSAPRSGSNTSALRAANAKGGDRRRACNGQTTTTISKPAVKAGRRRRVEEGRRSPNFEVGRVEHRCSRGQRRDKAGKNGATTEGYRPADGKRSDCGRGQGTATQTEKEKGEWEKFKTLSLGDRC